MKQKKPKVDLQVYNEDGVVRTDIAQKEVTAIQKTLKPIWKKLEKQGWKPNQIRDIVQSAVTWNDMWHTVGLL